MPVNFITLLKVWYVISLYASVDQNIHLQFFILCFHGNIGYVDDIFNETKTIFCRDLREVHVRYWGFSSQDCHHFCSRMNSSTMLLLRYPRQHSWSA